MDPALLVALRLSKDGYGTPEQILRMPVGIVLAAIEYSTFLVDYENTVIAMNRDDSK